MRRSFLWTGTGSTYEKTADKRRDAVLDSESQRECLGGQLLVTMTLVGSLYHLYEQLAA